MLFHICILLNLQHLYCWQKLMNLNSYNFVIVSHLVWSEADALFSLEINYRSLSQYQYLYHCLFSQTGPWTVFKSCPSPFHSAVTVVKGYWREANWPCCHVPFCIVIRNKPFLTMCYIQRVWETFKLFCGQNIFHKLIVKLCYWKNLAL